MKTFLTQQELARCTAVMNNKARELTPTEKVLLAAVEVSKKPVRDLSEIKDLVKLMSETAGGERLADKIQDAMADPTLMPAILDVYPLVEFNDVIMDKSSLNKYEMLYMGQTSYGQLEDCAMALGDLFSVMERLPKGVETFIGTPLTDYFAVRRMWEKTKEKKYLGLAINKSLQDMVNATFVGVNRFGHKDNRFKPGLVQVVMNEKSLFRRVREEAPVSDFVLSIEGVKEYDVVTFYCLKAVNEKTNTIYYFAF